MRLPTLIPTLQLSYARTPRRNGHEATHHSCESEERYFSRPGHRGDPSPVIGSHASAAGNDVDVGQQVPADVQALVPVAMV